MYRLGDVNDDWVVGSADLDTLDSCPHMLSYSVRYNNTLHVHGQRATIKAVGYIIDCRRE